MKVAVVGSGLAGLTTAYLLRKEGVEVYLIEKSDRLGFHSESVEIPLDGQNGVSDKATEGHQKWIVDVPMRGFQGGYYPLLLSLYQHLGIPLTPTSYTFSFSSPASTYFIHSGSSGFSIPSLPSGAFANPFTLLRDVLAFLGVALCYLLLVVLSFLAWHDLLPSALSSPTLTLRGFTTQLSTFLARPITAPIIGWSPWTPLGDMFEFFIAQIVIPLFSAVGTMTVKDVWSLPVRVILEYVHTTLGTSHYHLAKGYSAADVARLLCAPVSQQGDGHVRLSTEIVGLEHNPAGGIRVTLQDTKSVIGGGEEIVVDKVVLATQASAARRLLRTLESDLKQEGQVKEAQKVTKLGIALGEVFYTETIVINHRDTSILPAKKDQRDLNFFLPPIASSSSTQRCATDPLPSDTPYFSAKSGKIYAMATQIIPHPLRKGQTVLQTTNPVVPLDSAKVLSVSKLERALPLRRPTQTLSALRKNTGRIYIAGSYAYPGIPLLEGCVGSAKLAVEAILASTSSDADATSGRVWVREGVTGGVAGIDWDRGNGSWVGRAWRWRWARGSTWG